MTLESPNAEFRRRLRSLFAVLRAIVRHSSAGENSKDDYAALLEGRIGALARVHDMLMRAPEVGVDLEELVHGEMLAQAVTSQRYDASGRDTRIAQEAAMPVALALHELTVNALIHGAFAAPGGKVEISWEHAVRNGRRWLRFLWQEDGVPIPRNPPTSKGFGLELLEKTLPYELEACTRVDWADRGARFEIQIPSAASATFWRPGDGANSP